MQKKMDCKLKYSVSQKIWELGDGFEIVFVKISIVISYIVIVYIVCSVTTVSSVLYFWF